MQYVGYWSYLLISLVLAVILLFNTFHPPIAMKSALIRSTFENKFKQSPEILVNAPGRINLIGEHTDYNDGFVLPAAIDKSIVFAVGKRTDNLLKFHSVDLGESFEISLEDLKKSDKSWANYLIGVTKELIDNNHEIPTGFELTFGGDIPLGAGLSSSAAVACGLGFALNELFDLKLDRKDLALIAQKAEHNFAGVNCGIMDMYASLFGVENEVILLDCRDIRHRYFAFDFPDYAIVLCNTGVKHNLADSEYNTRRKECEAGVYLLQQINPEIKSLRDVSVSFFAKHRAKLPLLEMKRCRFVVTEIERVMWGCEALSQGDLRMFGSYMYQTHWGLSGDYEVSCKELDFLVKNTEQSEAVLGSRMMGGGFGGCTINIVRKDVVNDFIKKQTADYKEQFDLKLDCYVVKPSDGVKLV
ncbi:MAG: galactokinase [Spirosomaceae bacterium]|nr:galactokinase [Spirosomataceae bacterium]